MAEITCRPDGKSEGRSGMTDPYNGRYCKDCRWFFEKQEKRKGDGISTNVCGRYVSETNPVSGGSAKLINHPCFSLRNSIANACGPEGKLWEAKE